MDELDQLLMDTASLTIDASIPVAHTSFEMTSVSTELNEIQKAMKTKQDQIAAATSKAAVEVEDDTLPIVNHSRVMMLKPSEYAGKTGAVVDVLEKKYIVSYDNKYLRFKDVPTFKGFSKTKYLKKINKVPKQDPLTGQALQFPVHPVTGELVTDENEYNDLMNSLTDAEKAQLEYKKSFDDVPNPDFLLQKPAEESDRIFYDGQLGAWVIPGERSWVLQGDNLETRPVYGQIDKEIPERLKVQCVNDPKMIHTTSEYKSTKIQERLTRENFQSKYKLYSARGVLVYNNRVLNVPNRLDSVYKLLTSGNVENVVGPDYLDLGYQADTSLSTSERQQRDIEMEQKKSLLSLEYLFGIYNGQPIVIQVVDKTPMMITESPVIKKQDIFDYYLKEDDEVDFYILDQATQKVYSETQKQYLDASQFDISNHTTTIPEAIRSEKLKYDPYEPMHSFDINAEISKGKVFVYMKAAEGAGMYCKVTSRVPRMVEITARVTQVITGKQIRWDADGPKLKDGEYPLDIHMKSNENYLIRLDNTYGLPMLSHRIIRDGSYLPSPILKSHFMFMDGETEQGMHFEVLEDRKNYIRAKVLDGESFTEQSLLKYEVKFTPEFLKANPEIFSTVSDDTKKWLDYKLGDWDTSSGPPSPPAYIPDSPLQPLKGKFKKRDTAPQEQVQGPPRLVIRPKGSDDDASPLDLNLDFNTPEQQDFLGDDLDDLLDESREMDYATEELPELGDDADLFQQPEEQEQKVGFNQLSQIESFEKGLNKDQREVLKLIRRILRAFNYTEYDPENVEEIIVKFLAYKDYIKESLKASKQERTFTEEPQMMLLLIMCYNLIVMREIITLKEYLEATVFKKYLNTPSNKKFIKEVQRPTRTIVTLDKTNLKYVWVDAQSTLFLESCDKEAYQETNISNLPDVSSYIKYINNIICFLKMNQYTLYVSTMSVVPDDLTQLGKRQRVPESQVTYELLEEKKQTAKKQKQSKILQDMEYLEQQRSKKQKKSEPKLEESTSEQERTKQSVYSRIPKSQVRFQDPQEPMRDTRPTKEEEDLIKQEANITVRLKAFDKLLADATKQRPTKDQGLQISPETLQELRPYVDKKASLANFAKLEQRFPDAETTKSEAVITDAILERDRQRRAEFMRQMETLDAEDLAELSEQDRIDLETAKNTKKQTHEELQSKFDSVISKNYGAPEYADLRAVLVDKQDDLDFIRGLTPPRDDTDAAARKILVLFYKAVKDNHKRYEEIQKRRVEIMERVNKARKIRKERQRLLKEFETASEMGNILGQYKEKERQSESVQQQKRRRESDLTSLFGEDSDSEDEMSEASEASEASTKSAPSIFMPRRKQRTPEKIERIRAKRRIQQESQKEREQQQRELVKRRRQDPELMAQIRDRSEREASSMLRDIRVRSEPKSVGSVVSAVRKRFRQKWQPYKPRK